MAINNWRYVVTWGYIDPNGNIIEEIQPSYETVQPTSYRIVQPTINNREGYVPMASTTFSPAETYKMRADWYYNLWDTNLWDAYSALWSWSNAYTNTAKQINDFYSQLGGDVTQREIALAWIKSDLADKLYNDMLQTKQYVVDTFGPEWTLTTEINKYYDDLWNYLATDAGRQAAIIAAQWIHSWASLWAIRAQQNEAYNESFGRYIQAKEQEINAKQTIASNLINYMSTLRQEYWDTTNQYIIQQYQRANDLLNTISQSIANTNMEIASAKLSNSVWWSSSSGSNVILPAWTAAKLYNSLSDADKAAFDALSASQQQKVLTNLYYQNLKNSSSTETATETPVWESWSTIVKNWNSSKKY